MKHLIVANLHHHTTTIIYNVKENVAFLHQFTTSCDLYIELTYFFS